MMTKNFHWVLTMLFRLEALTKKSISKSLKTNLIYTLPLQQGRLLLNYFVYWAYPRLSRDIVGIVLVIGLRGQRCSARSAQEGVCTPLLMQKISQSFTLVLFVAVFCASAPPCCFDSTALSGGYIPSNLPSTMFT